MRVCGRRHLHHLLDLPLRAPNLVKMRMETAWEDWAADGAAHSSQDAETLDPVSAALPPAAAPPEAGAVLGAYCPCSFPR